MFRGRRSLAGATTALLLALAMTGCTPDPAPSPTPTGFASEEEAFAAAEATYRAYVDAVNHVDLSDPATFEPVYAWTTSDALANEKTSLTSMHAEGLTVEGTSRVVLVHPLSLKMHTLQDAELAICVDVSQISLFRTDGTSAVSPDRPDIQSMTVLVTRADLSDTEWLIANVSGREGSPLCPES